MNWYAISPKNHVRWYPYIRDNQVWMHPENADTDMSDFTLDELVRMIGPVIVGPMKDQDNEQD